MKVLTRKVANRHTTTSGAQCYWFWLLKSCMPNAKKQQLKSFRGQE